MTSVKKVKDLWDFLYLSRFLENIDRLALSQAGVIQLYQLDALSVRKEEGKIHLVLHINHSYDMQVNLILKADIYGDLSVGWRTPSKALKALEDASYQKRLTLISQKADAITPVTTVIRALSRPMWLRSGSKMKKTSLTQLDKVLQDIDQESGQWAQMSYVLFPS